MTVYMALMEELGIFFSEEPPPNSFSLFGYILSLLENLEAKKKTPLEFILDISPYLTKQNSWSDRKFLQILLSALRKSTFTAEEKELALKKLRQMISSAPASLSGWIMWIYLKIKRQRTQH